MKSKSNTMQYRLISYDVWGDFKTGFEVNAAYYTSYYFDIGEEDSDYKINRMLGVRGIEYERYDNALYARVKRNGKPAFELRLVNGE